MRLLLAALWLGLVAGARQDPELVNPLRANPRAVVPGRLIAPVQSGTVITFEDLESTGSGTGGQTRIDSQYRRLGVTFNRPYLLDYSKGIAVPGVARSGTRAIEHCYAQEFCTTPFEMTFARPQSRVKVWVGNSGRSTAGVIDVVLEVFDANARLVGTAAGRVDATRGPAPIATPLEVALDGPEIRTARVRKRDPNAIMNDLALDDVEFEAAVRLPDLAIEALEQDGDGSTVQATLRNAGSVASQATTLELRDGGTLLGAAAVAPLQPGETSVVPLTLRTALAPGEYALTASVDPRGRVRESREDNNTAELDFRSSARVPGVIGATLADAGEALRNASLRPEPSEAGASPTRTVAAQDPQPGALVPAGSAVALELAPEPVPVPVVPPTIAVPSLVGAPLEDARAQLAAVGLVGVVASGDVSPSAVVSAQAPAPGTDVPVGATIALTLERSRSWLPIAVVLALVGVAAVAGIAALRPRPPKPPDPSRGEASPPATPRLRFAHEPDPGVRVLVERDAHEPLPHVTLRFERGATPPKVQEPPS